MPKERREVSFWDSFHSLYQMGPAKHRTYLLERMRQLGIESFLDVGCGTGPLYQLNGLLERPFWYKGTDYSWAMIEQCHKHFPGGNFEVQDARKLKEKDNSWDGVVLMHCLDHLDDYKAAINEATRVAKKYVVIILWRDFVGEYTHLNNKNRMNKNEGEPDWEDTYLQEYSKEALYDAFKEAKLKVIEETSGEVINDPGKYNFIFWLEKYDQ